jgi:hypothetical protein
MACENCNDIRDPRGRFCCELEKYVRQCNDAETLLAQQIEIARDIETARRVVNAADAPIDYISHGDSHELNAAVNSLAVLQEHRGQIVKQTCGSCCSKYYVCERVRRMNSDSCDGDGTPATLAGATASAGV